MAQETDPSHEFWLGAHATQDTWFVYLGGTTAPFGDLNHDGFRLRAVVGHGEYRYEGHQLRIDPDNTVRFAPVAFTDRVTFTDALIGYAVQLGPLTAKAFAGLAFIEHDVSASPGFAATLEGTAWGPKVQAEFWYDAGGPYWLALNAGYTTAYDTYSVNSRTGFRLGDGGWSIGTELNLDNRATDGVSLNGAYARGGLPPVCLGAGRDLRLRRQSHGSGRQPGPADRPAAIPLPGHQPPDKILGRRTAEAMATAPPKASPLPGSTRP